MTNTVVGCTLSLENSVLTRILQAIILLTFTRYILLFTWNVKLLSTYLTIAVNGFSRLLSQKCLVHWKCMYFHIWFSCKTFGANGTLELRWHTTFIDHVPAQQFFSVDSFVEVSTTIWTNRWIWRCTPV